MKSKQEVSVMKMWVRRWILGIVLVLSVAIPAVAQSLLKDINTLMGGPHPSDLVSIGTKAFFKSGSELWVVDEAGVHMRRVFKDWPGDLHGPGNEPWMTSLNGQVLIRVHGSNHPTFPPTIFGDLWISDGTSSGTFSLTETDIESRYRIGDGVTLGNRVYFLKQLMDGHDIVRSELWITDGTKEGTERLTSFRVGTEGVVESLHAFGGHLWFVATRFIDRRNPARYELIQYDLVSRKSKNTGFTSTSYMGITGTSDSKLFMFADADEAGIELWAMDRTSLNPQRMGDFLDDARISTYDLWGIATTGNFFLFKSLNPSRGSDLFASDGTPQGTRLLTSDMGPWMTWNPGRKSGVVGNRVLFQAPDLTGKERIWTTNGTVESTGILTWPESGEPFQSTDGFATFGNELFFASWQRTSGWEVWATDGSSDGTRLAADIYPGSGGSSAGPVVATYSGVLGPARDPHGNWNLWFSSGTPGTHRMVPFVSDHARNNSSSPERFRKLGGKVYFTAGTESTGRELWGTDGTVPNTRMVLPERQIGTASNAMTIGTVGDRLLVASDNNLYALSAESDTLTRISKAGQGPFHFAQYRIDRMFYDTSSPRALFFAIDGIGNPELWESDGTREGTWKVSSFGMAPTRTDFLDKALGVVSGRYLVAKVTPDGEFIYAVDPATGTAERLLDAEVWAGNVTLQTAGDEFFLSYHRSGSNYTYKTDGTRLGTQQVDFTGGPGLPEVIHRIHPHQNGMLILGSTSESGAEMWFSNGTLESTRYLGDLCPDHCASGPRSLVNVGEHVFFAIENGRDDDVWVTDGTLEGTKPVLSVETNEGEHDFHVRRIMPFEEGVLVATTEDKHQIWYADASEGSGRMISDGFDDGYAFLDDIQHGAVLGRQFIFAAEHPLYGYELFKLDLPGRATSVGAEETIPTTMVVHSGYPNPFNQQLTVAFDLPTTMDIRIEVFDMLGRRVWTEKATRLPSGTHTRTLELDPELASGVYHVRVQDGPHSQTIRAVKVD